ncbi:MAG TPA: RNB domain-containing ribonuclease [Casimicrobiaceae bacterium]|nr:RNB domain-containing ribonuclease [Casimicrobiaceae bacterium]
MNVLFEDDGQVKAGTVLADQDTSLQVEAVSGKRIKVKAANVLMRFATPSAAEAMAQAHALTRELDPDFLWEASGEGEFGFDDLAQEYYGGRPAAAESAAVALLLHASPMHFYKRGKGRYRKAPADALKAALASVERKKREATQIEEWVRALRAGELPEAIRSRLPMLLYQPDKNALEWKAVNAAAEASRTSIVALLASCGAITSTHDYHFNGFLAQAFPRGIAFPADIEVPPSPELPLAAVRAFSIDDASTTEIDDAFSVRELAGGNIEIGIHIACPALAVTRGSPLDAVARARLSTVYMPGRKITMLPDPLIESFTLAAGTTRPALSLYVETTPAGVPVSASTRLERLEIEANLRLDAIDERFAAAASLDEPPWTAELRRLWQLARHLADARGKNDINRIDYNFVVDWDAQPDGRVSIVPRPRGSPLDKLIAELMIHVNSTWGRMLADARMSGLYRVQSGGKVKMSTRPGEHQGLGLSHYLWASSPLRRYSDLVNQRQLMAAVRGDKPVYADNDAELFAALADFEATYSQYAEFQERMEHYWCLRWLLQEKMTETTAHVIRDNLVRFAHLPIVMRLADLPGSTAPDTAVRVAIGRIDLLAATLECRYAGPA